MTRLSHPGRSALHHAAHRAARLVPVAAVALIGVAFARNDSGFDGAIAFDSEMETVSGIRELSDGRAVVLDARGGSLFLFDWSSGRTTRISRGGYGPREYARPMRLIALAYDSTLVHDPGNERYLVLGASGQPIGAIPEFGVRGTRTATYEVTVHEADRAGWLYFALPRALVRDRDEGTPILRLDRRSLRTDTVGHVTEGADDWMVLPDGGIAIVRADPFRIEWHPAEGDPVVGPVAPYARNKPGGDAPAALLAPNGWIWVARVAGDWRDVATYDIFDRTGARVERMTLPAGSRVVGFGRGRVYVVRTDADGETYLDRFPTAG